MIIKRRTGWELPEGAVTPEGHYLDRRRLIVGMGFAGLILGAPALLGGHGDAAPIKSRRSQPGGVGAEDLSASLYPAPRNTRHRVDAPMTPAIHVTSFNNFYEFGSHKAIAEAAQALPIRPWQVRFDGLVETEMTLDVDDLLKRVMLEERVYRHRCVEAWSMVVPWTGFPLKALIDLARPRAAARYVAMETFSDPGVAPGQRQTWYPWPYVEGLTIEEATHDLAFIATGLYGKPLPRQNGAPLRLAVPWKYGFKSIKSIVRFHFTDRRPRTFWDRIQPNEYGFWANVNPTIPHARWSQATERVLGTEVRIPTRIYNGYGEFVAPLYEGLAGERLFT